MQRLYARIPSRRSADARRGHTSPLVVSTARREVRPRAARQMAEQTESGVLLPGKRAEGRSSTGQSTRLQSEGLQVQVLPPLPNTNRCIDSNVAVSFRDVM